jgi:flavin reductase (DIM6/NTAB) family NADH-FMN oxidoreductase RutF
LWLKATVHNQVVAGDHDIVILEIQDLGFDDAKTGMVFHQGAPSTTAMGRHGPTAQPYPPNNNRA